jgi:hypothetical protein
LPNADVNPRLMNCPVPLVTTSTKRVVKVLMGSTRMKPLWSASVPVVSVAKPVSVKPQLGLPAGARMVRSSKLRVPPERIGKAPAPSIPASSAAKLGTPVDGDQFDARVKSFVAPVQV